MVRKATEQQKNELEGVYMGTRLKFHQDNDGNWVISEDAIDYPKFASIKEKLLALTQIPHKPKIVKIP